MSTELHPEVRAFLDALNAGFPDVTEHEPAALREMVLSRRGPLEAEPPMAEVHDVTIDGPGGDLALRVFRPTADTDLPVIVYAHGGGFVFCNLDTHDEFCRTIAKEVGALVISVDYRLAPEHPAPAAHDDFHAAVRWAAEHAAEYGGDPARIAVAGDSAGGNLAATVALAARDHGPDLVGQVLIYAVIDDDLDTESYRKFGEGYYNTTKAMGWYWEQYAPGDRNDPRIIPTVADSLAGVAPAVVVSAELDPPCSSNNAYAERLAADGVRVLHKQYDGLFHGFFTFPALSLTGPARQELFAMIRELLGA